MWRRLLCGFFLQKKNGLSQLLDKKVHFIRRESSGNRQTLSSSSCDLDGAAIRIPKILRGYFRRNRKLLKLLIQSANFAVEQYFHETPGIEGGYTGGVFCIQSHGSLFNRRSAPFPPHIHALALGGILKDDKFYQTFQISADVIAGIFRARLLATLLKQEVITQELIDLLMSWNHNSGFNVHSKQKINGANGDRIEKIARYMSRAAISVERVEFNPEENTVTVYEKQKKTFSSKKAHYDILEFMALLAGHIPSPYETITFYYGEGDEDHLL